MDGICSAVLNKINALGAAGRYFIVSADEFLEEFPEGAERDDAELKKAIKDLVSGGYIDVKYSSGNMYCVALLRNYVPEPDVPTTAITVSNSTESAKTSHRSLFWAAFAGGAAGGIVTVLISLLFLLC